MPILRSDLLRMNKRYKADTPKGNNLQAFSEANDTNTGKAPEELQGLT